jgi:hypothetical protein
MVGEPSRHFSATPANSPSAFMHKCNLREGPLRQIADNASLEGAEWRSYRGLGKLLSLANHVEGPPARTT